MSTSNSTPNFRISPLFAAYKALFAPWRSLWQKIRALGRPHGQIWGTLAGASSWKGEIVVSRSMIWHSAISSALAVFVTCNKRPSWILIGYTESYTFSFASASVGFPLQHACYGKRYMPLAGHTAKFEVLVAGASSWKRGIVLRYEYFHAPLQAFISRNLLHRHLPHYIQGIKWWLPAEDLVGERWQLWHLAYLEVLHLLQHWPPACVTCNCGLSAFSLADPNSTYSSYSPSPSPSSFTAPAAVVSRYSSHVTSFTGTYTTTGKVPSDNCLLKISLENVTSPCTNHLRLRLRLCLCPRPPLRVLRYLQLRQ